MALHIKLVYTYLKIEIFSIRISTADLIYTFPLNFDVIVRNTSDRIL